MIETIKALFAKMNDKTRDEALERLAHEFNLESPKFVKKNWISGGRIPLKEQKRTLQLLQKLLATQVKAIQQIVFIF